jgi:Flp pilus assembly protein TadB
MMLLAVLAGAVVGLGILIAARAVRPATVPLAEVLAGLETPVVAAAAVGRERRVLAHRLVSAVGVHIDDRRPDFVILERAAADHAARKVTAAAAGSIATGLLLGAGRLSGLPIAEVVLVALIGAAGAAGFVFPDLRLKEDAARQRQAFRHALSAYLDLVNVILAGGGGLDTALHAAAEAGDGPAFAQLRHALARARLTGRSPWDVLAELGGRLEVSELGELAASVSLAGTHGARIRQSLAAKADALRGHQQAEIEGEAEAATERMTIPVAVLLFGFLVFIAYPALVQITSITQSTP